MIARVPPAALDPANRLLADYAAGAAPVRGLFAFVPDDDGLRARAALPAPNRTAIAAALTAYNQALGADAVAVDNARRLAEPETLVVTVGQQPGLLTGPLYTPLKALTAVALARRVATVTGRHAVPVFWLGCDDDDRAEADHCGWWDAHGALHAIHYPDDAGTPGTLIGSLPTAGDAVLAQVTPLLDGMPFAAEVERLLRDTLADSPDLGGWCARLLVRVLSRHGLVLCDSRLPAVRDGAVPVLRAELDAPLHSTALVDARARAVHALGYHPALTKPADVCNFFLLDDAGRRRRVTFADGRFYAGGSVFTATELRARLDDDPASFIPNAVLRPVVQEALFGSTAFVAGPNEVCYWAELQPLFPAATPMPPVFPRTGATLVLPRVAALLREWEVDPSALLLAFDATRKALVSRHAPPDVQAAFAEGRARLDAAWADLVHAIQPVDATLAPSAMAGHQRMLHELERLEGKTLKALERRDGELTARLERTRESLFPGHGLQERTLNLFAAIARCGLDLPDRLLSLLDRQEGQHLFVEI
jgi:bacillithiol biosynthesis cysteine-adding enzyme BshC